jgi:(S)-2-hydroxyglutarate dehydrogenase
MEKLDAIVIGAGAVGVSTAYHLALLGADVAVVEKESGPAMHQSGRNSGVIHAGYNVKPGSLKAQYCVEGNRQLRDYCNEHEVPVREGGILIAAHTSAEMSVIGELERRGLENGTDVRILDQAGINEVEPHVQALGALQALDGASLDSRAYVQSLANDANQLGVKFYYDRQVRSFRESEKDITVVTNKGDLAARVAVNAAGLYADELADELASDMRVLPFRGYYAELTPEKSDLVKSHIYAAPDLDFPFLGVHLSKRTDGRVIVGPGAMLAFGREAYTFGSLDGGRLGKTLSWPGFYRMLMRPEFRNLFRQEIKKSLMVREIGKEAMRLVPELSEKDFVRSYAGNRAQLVDKKGQLVDDIVVRDTARSVHVLNAVSPGLTCSLPFGKDLAEQAKSKL